MIVQRCLTVLACLATVSNAQIAEPTPLFEAVSNFALTNTIFANAGNYTFPFWSLPQFEILASNVCQENGCESIAICPLVASGQLAEWVAYSAAYQGWIAESYLARNSSSTPPSIEPFPYTFDGNGQVEMVSSATFFAPIWQITPPPPSQSTTPPRVNYNLPSETTLESHLSTLLLTNSPVVTGVLGDELERIYGDVLPSAEGPYSLLFEPIFSSFDTGNSFVVAVATVLFSWTDILPDVLLSQPGPLLIGRDLQVVLENGVQTFTFSIAEDQSVSYVGEGDLHETVPGGTLVSYTNVLGVDLGSVYDLTVYVVSELSTPAPSSMSITRNPRVVRATKSLSDTTTVFASFQNFSFPFVTLPQFERLAAGTRTMAGSALLAWSPLVTAPNRETWEAYSVAFQGWIVESYQIIGATVSPGPIPTTVYALDLGGQAVSSPFPGPFAPIWQVSPPPMNPPNLINYDLLSNDILSSYLTTLVGTKQRVATATLDLASGYGSEAPTSSGPQSLLLEPILNVVLGDALVVGMLQSVISWDILLSELIAREGIVQGDQVVIQSDCQQVFTYQMNDLTYLGEGDLHDTAFDGTAVQYDTILGPNVGGCVYSMTVFASVASSAMPTGVPSAMPSALPTAIPTAMPSTMPSVMPMTPPSAMAPPTSSTRSLSFWGGVASILALGMLLCA